MKKKGSLSLSVNAIVVLILAITMLGLGLGFIRGMFGKVSGSIDEAISSEPEPPSATGANPIALSREAVITAAGETEVIKIAAYNPTNGAWTNAKPDLSCGTSITFADDGSDISVNPRNIAVGGKDTFNMLVKIPSGTTIAKHLCQITIYKDVSGTLTATDYTKDLSIDVRQ